MKQCIAQLLGLQGWIIYQLKIESDRIDVYAGRPRKEASCPFCQTLTRRVYDRSRKWYKNVAHFHWAKEQLRDVYRASCRDQAP